MDPYNILDFKVLLNKFGLKRERSRSFTRVLKVCSDIKYSNNNVMEKNLKETSNSHVILLYPVKCRLRYWYQTFHLIILVHDSALVFQCEFASVVLCWENKHSE